MTLIELLVVVTILMIVAAAVIPKLRPAMDQERMREASRSLHLYLSSARNAAMSQGRSCGIKIERLVTRAADGSVKPVEHRCATAVSQVETPPPYAGDLLESRLVVQYFEDQSKSRNDPLRFWRCTNKNTGVRSVFFVARPMPGDISHLAGLRFKDMIQLNGQGPFYEIISPTTLQQQYVNSGSPEAWDNNAAPTWIPTTPTNTNDANLVDFSTATDSNTDGYVEGAFLILRLDISNGRPEPPWAHPLWVTTPTPPSNDPYYSGYWSSPVTFSATRQPVKSTVAPLQLPSPAVIDLALSGGDFPRPSDPGSAANIIAAVRPYSFGYVARNNNGNLTSPPAVVIMFSPTGALERVYYDQWGVGPTVTWTPCRVKDSLLLQIGKRENMSPLSDWNRATDADTNLDETTGLIISINARTGLITTSDIMPSTINPASESNADIKELRQWQKLYDCRSYARQVESKGGR